MPVDVLSLGLGLEPLILAGRYTPHPACDQGRPAGIRLLGG